MTATHETAVRRRRWVREEELSLVRSKFDRILQLAKGRDVLDVGCIGGDRNVDISKTVHAQLASVARTCVGIDVDSVEVERWRALGHDVVVADAEEFHLERTFDIVVAADVIEHLANPGRFLERVKKHLRHGGRLCIVTPNALSLNSALKSLAGLRVAVNPEHTCWYDHTTLRQLLSRYDFNVEEEYWQDYERHPLSALFLRFRKNLAAHFIMIAQFNRGESES